MRPRYGAGERRDANEPEIVEEFELWGVTTTRIRGTTLGRRCDRKGVPDLLAGYRDQTHLVEVKVPGESPSEDQRLWDRRWRGGRVEAVSSREDVRRLVQLWRECDSPRSDSM